jgi:hypothetical protein
MEAMDCIVFHEIQEVKFLKFICSVYSFSMEGK